MTYKDNLSDLAVASALDENLIPLWVIDALERKIPSKLIAKITLRNQAEEYLRWSTSVRGFAAIAKIICGSILMIAAISANKHYLTEPLSITDALATAAVGVLFVGLVAVASSGVPRRMAGLIAFRKELENFLDQSFMSYSYLICREAEACNHIHFRLTNSAVQIRFAEQAMREQQQNQPNANHSAALQQAWNAFIPLFEYFKSLGLAKLGDDDGYGEYFRLADEKLAKLGDK